MLVIDLLKITIGYMHETILLLILISKHLTEVLLDAVFNVGHLLEPLSTNKILRCITWCN
jgi:hypothetical protein